MDELSKKDDAESHYFLGCGAYNLSYWGNSWILARSWRTIHDMDKERLFHVSPWLNINEDYYQLHTAKKHFEQALAKTKDREFQARIYYSLAMVERIHYGINYEQNTPQFKKFNEKYDDYHKAIEKYDAHMQEKLKDYHTNFTILKNQYSQTKFHQLLIDECSTYEHFVSGK
jgi:tetratricopeptide (TPR) repeat protein